MDEANAFIRERLKKLEDLSRDGIDPYPSTFPITHLAGDLTSRHATADDAALAAAGPVTLGGRKRGQALIICLFVILLCDPPLRMRNADCGMTGQSGEPSNAGRL